MKVRGGKLVAGSKKSGNSDLGYIATVFEYISWLIHKFLQNMIKNLAVI